MTLNCILITLLVGAIPASAAELTVAEQVAKLKVGRKIKVELKSGETLKGRMGSPAADQFTLEPRGTAQGTARIVRFNEARSVKPDGLTAGEKWAIFGVIWVVVGIVAKLPFDPGLLRCFFEPQFIAFEQATRSYNSLNSSVTSCSHRLCHAQRAVDFDEVDEVVRQLRRRLCQARG